MAELYEVQLEDLNNAFHCYARALAEDPGNHNTQEQLERIAGSAQAWQPLAETYEAQLQHTEDAHIAASLHAKVADIRETKLGDAAGAIAHYKRVLELDETSLDAAGSLERLYLGAQRYEELAGVYLTKAAMLDTPPRRRSTTSAPASSTKTCSIGRTRRSRSTRSRCRSSPTTSRRSTS